MGVVIQEEQVLFAFPYEEESDILYARDYCTKNNLTQETARIVIEYNEQGEKEWILVKKRILND